LALIYFENVAIIAFFSLKLNVFKITLDL